MLCRKLEVEEGHNSRRERGGHKGESKSITRSYFVGTLDHSQKVKHKGCGRKSPSKR